MYIALQKRDVDNIDNWVRYHRENIKFSLYNLYIKNMTIYDSLHPFLQASVPYNRVITPGRMQKISGFGN